MGDKKCGFLGGLLGDMDEQTAFLLFLILILLILSFS